MRRCSRPFPEVKIQFPRTVIPNHSAMCVQDDWPEMPDGSDFDGMQLLTLVRRGNSPFHGVWDVNLLIREIEENLST